MTASGPTHARLLELVAAAARIAEASDPDAVLETTARVLMESLGMESAAINRLVPADDEYEVTALLGGLGDGEALLASRLKQSFVEEVLLDPAFAVLPDVFVFPSDPETMARVSREVESIPSARPPIDAPDAWRDHGLLLALRARGGELLAILSLDDPTDGRLPSEATLAEAALLLHHAGTALEGRLAEVQAGRAHEEATALAAIASSLESGLDERELLTRAAQGVCSACGYGSAVVSILSADGEAMEKVAAVGEEVQSLIGIRQPARLYRDLMRTGALLSSSHLLAGDEVVAAGGQVLHRSAHHGRGRRGWRDHHLVVPMDLAGGPLLGILEVDDPVDRMIPSLDRLRLLEAFAQQMALVLDASRRLAEAREAAAVDPLTKLPNRSRIFDRIDEALADGESATAVLFLDIDGLKAVNDRYGHEAGDQLLVAVSRRLRLLVRSGDTVGHLSGDEFVVVCPGMDGAALTSLAARTLASIESPFEVGGEAITVTASIGLAVARPGVTAEALLRSADGAMYRAKAAGRNQAVVTEAE